MATSTFGVPISSRRSVFVSYHHGGDQRYYDDLTSSMHDRLRLITDKSLERRIDSADSAYVMRRIRDLHLHGSSCTLVLCGAETWRRKWVDWEIHASLTQKMGLVGIWLPNLPLIDGGTSKPARLQDNVDSQFAQWVSWSDIAANPVALTAAIERANSASRLAIRNERARMARNL
ncbi:TIR domain-containing protein [Sphingomonas aurantiaca]|uniref:TIR domain-containing protein n=1 Tax=Sphingomonas aurantiaca TaxID=185949 RepID=UPI003354EE71